VRTSGQLSARDDREAPVPGPFGEQLAAGEAAARASHSEDAIASFKRAKALFPEYAGPDSPYRALAAIYHERGDYQSEERELQTLVGIADDDYDAHLSLAAVRLRLADTVGAISALEGAMYVSPYDPELHAQLATLAGKAGDHAREVRERRAVLALRPVDVAEAEYELARAYLASGDRAAARGAVLRALERAPNYPKAQDLLLELRGPSRPQGSN
jgi:tetratricopeptide (TPR) repeat protein